jgi:hypothetical protein
MTARKTIMLGKGKVPYPAFSKILTRSEYVQINSITQRDNLKRGLKTD